MLRTVREREQPGMADAPLLERAADGRDKRLPNAGVPQIGPNGDRPEIPDAAPTRREIGAGEPTFVIGGERTRMLGAEAAIRIIALVPEGLRVGRAEKRTERDPDQPRRFR